MNFVYILLGANLGNPIQQLKEAIIELSTQIGHVTKISSIYESEAWGVEDQPKFYNQVLALETPLAALDVLTIALQIEQKLGRVRTQHWGARIIDIDLLYFNDEIIQLDHLIIPHPYLHKRNFTLVPLVEIAPNLIHPILGKTNTQLEQESEDNLKVNKI
ncbi:2-amino-4-hydroxy-6-hydroxymethyldihydropteridine diphosphokinase [Sphingobacterium sp. HJSM2_6]|uniref:2-amino-4-hydroxy-6- hydroxymethyldihydropteridine diphosphokinase n=1 Tax=Sphingobacterium sp. HJSM2_6 TaxID=3366264 RepID=UPI003BBCE843